MDTRVVVVGAGIAGVACARELARAGVTVTVLDRGRRVGDRMAARRFDGRPVDLGASYLTEDGLAIGGDGWGHPTRVQTAWLSGCALGQALAARLG